MVASTRKTEKLIFADKSRSKKFAVSAKTPLKKLLLSATLEWNRIREAAKPPFFEDYTYYWFGIGYSQKPI